MDHRAETTEVARVDSERGEVALLRRRSPTGPDVLELRVNGVFVMDTAETSTETALAAAALDAVPMPRRVVIGGLGLGFTLERVLADQRVEEVAVVEVEEAVIDWMRDGTVPHGPALLADRRVRLVNADIAMAVAEARGRWDLLLLDVDNGPGYLVHEDNQQVYRAEFLTRCRALLGDEGSLVVWSADRAPELLATLDEVFGRATQTAYDVDLQGRAETYWLIHAGGAGTSRAR